MDIFILFFDLFPFNRLIIGIYSHNHCLIAGRTIDLSNVLKQIPILFFAAAKIGFKVGNL